MEISERQVFRNKDQLVISKSKSGDLDIKITKKEGTYKSFWNDSKYDASTYGTKLLKAS